MESRSSGAYGMIAVFRLGSDMSHMEDYAQLAENWLRKNPASC